MSITQKTLKLSYTEEKNGKVVKKAYAFDLARDAEPQRAKEIGEQLATLINEDIEAFALITAEDI